MEDLFRSYWWLLFPLAWFIGSGWTSWLNYRRQRETLDIVRRYADSGREVPPELMKVLDRPIDSDAEFWGAASYESNRRTNYWSLFGLFAVLALLLCLPSRLPPPETSDDPSAHRTESPHHV